MVRAACLLSLSLSSFACADRDPPLVDQPTQRASAAPFPWVISQKPGFYFLPPLVRDVPRHFTEPFEAGLEPTVEIAQMDPVSGAIAGTVAEWSASSSEGVEISASGESYAVDWQTARYDLDPEQAYRLGVSVADEELGMTILHVTDSSGGPAERQRGPARVRLGEVFPIEFRIERRAVDRDSDGVIDRKDNCPTIPNPAGRSGGQLDTDGDGVGDACECSTVLCEALDACHPVGHCDPETGRCSAPSLPDDDGDGVCDVLDPCPSDAEKQAPGVCGCGVPDTDSDGDETPDCVDGCPLDAAKVEPGSCGCGALDTDTDRDAVPDCQDGCSLDSEKVSVGVCGCGVSDEDSDGDGQADCEDECPRDAEKTEAGACGCGVLDLDGDSDGAPDCYDACPADAGKVEPGWCGCGALELDSDGDGQPNCTDGCPNDPLKLEAGACGCGGLDTDSDSDGFADCVDACPGDAAKVEPGVCGCFSAETDSDLDGAPDCVDPCPSDPTRSESGPCGAGPRYIDLTWMTITNLYLEMGPIRALIDGYVTRIPRSNFYGGGGGLQNTHSPSVPDVALVSQLLAALGGPPNVNLLLTGHSHFDHSFDTATWSSLTNAPIIGSRTTCFQAIAQGIPGERCTEVLGGETLLLANGVTLRVIRWNHSGDDVTNPEQHGAVELDAVPVLDPVSHGLRAGVSEDFPNGGGGRAFLFTIDGPEGPYSLLFMDSGGAKDLDYPIVIDGLDYGAPLQNLEAALADAGLTSVDLLVGPSTNGGELAKVVVPLARPKAYIPVHWDDYFAAFLSQPRTFRDTAFSSYLTQQNVRILAPVQVMDKWRLSRGGVEAIANPAVKAALPAEP